jgi:hypothetical protein
VILLVVPLEVDVGECQKRRDYERAVDNAEHAVHAQSADYGEKYQEGVHFNLGTHHLRFDKIFHAHRQDEVKDKEKDSGAHPVVYREKNRGRDHHQPNPENGQKGQDRHHRPPQNGGVQPQDRESGAPQDALDEAADTVTLEDGIGYLVKPADQQAVLVFGERGEPHRVGDESGLVDKQEKDDHDHDEKQQQKLHDVGSPAAGLIIQEQPASLDQVGEGIGHLRRVETEAHLPKLVLELQDDGAFLEPQLQPQPHPAVPSPAVETQRLVRDRENKKDQGDDDDCDDEHAGEHRGEGFREFSAEQAVNRSKQAAEDEGEHQDRPERPEDAAEKENRNKEYQHEIPGAVGICRLVGNARFFWVAAHFSMCWDIWLSER